jgi:sodium-dependent phosphate transporter
MSTPTPTLSPLRFTAIELPINSHLHPSIYEFGIAGRGAYDYQWIYVVACINAFLLAAGCGANDVANAFATSVGAGTIKMWHAIVIASICEFLGAFLLGSRNIETIRGGIVSNKVYTNHEDLLMFGMMITLFIAGVWQFVASYLELNVSTTHSVIGCIIGFALCTPAGAQALNWTVVGTIVASWFTSPILVGLLAAFIFGLCRHFIFRHPDAYNRSFYAFPIIAFFTFFLNIFFIMYAGAGLATGKGLSRVHLPVEQGVGIALGVAFGLALIIAICINPLIRKFMDSKTDEEIAHMFAGTMYHVEKKSPTPFTRASSLSSSFDVLEGNHQIMMNQNGNQQQQQLTTINGNNTSEPAAATTTTTTNTADNTTNNNSSNNNPPPKKNWEYYLDKALHQDFIHSSIVDNTRVKEMHEAGEVFPIRVEATLGFLQVFTAAFASFAHGANDVANAVGPLASVTAIYQHGVGAIAAKVPVSNGIIAIGASGLVVGLALYGHVIISAMGVKSVRITPSRGFAIEYASATIIIISAYVGIPLSTSQAFVGGLLGIGLMESNKKISVNWKLFGKQLWSWIYTLVLMGAITALTFSIVTFAPSQIYPLSQNNCLVYYGEFRNVSNGDNTTYTFVANDYIIGMVGYPSSGVVVPV